MTGEARDRRITSVQPRLRNERLRVAFLVSALGASLASLPVTAQDVSIVRDPQPNGATLLAVPDSRWPLVRLEVRIRPGALADPSGQPGTAALTAATLMESAVDGRPLSSLLDFYGAEVSVQPTWNDVRIRTECLSSVFPEVFKAIAAAITGPSFAAEPLSRARERLLVALRTESQSPGTSANRAFQHLVYAGQRLGDPEGGTDASLSSLTARDLSAFYERHYRGPAVTVLVSGQVNLATVQHLMRESYGSLKQRPPGEDRTSAASGARPDTSNIPYASPSRNPVNGVQTWFIERDITPQVRLGHTVAARPRPDHVLTTVLNHIFGGAVNSRLMKIFREQRAMTYGIGSVMPDKDANSLFMIWTFTEAPKLRAMIEGLRAEVARLRNEPVSDDELNAARQALRNQFLYGFETAPAVADLASEYPGLGIPQMKSEYLAALDGVTPARLQGLARATLDPNRLSLLVVGREREVAPVLKQLGAYRKVRQEY